MGPDAETETKLLNEISTDEEAETVSLESSSSEEEEDESSSGSIYECADDWSSEGSVRETKVRDLLQSGSRLR